MKNIEFFIPRDQTIPTDLRLFVEGKHIYYERIHGEFGYEFTCYDCDEDLALEISERIARIT